MNYSERGPRQLKSLKRSIAEHVAPILLIGLATGLTTAYYRQVGNPELVSPGCDPELGHAAVRMSGIPAIAAMHIKGVKNIEVRVPNYFYRTGAEHQAILMKKSMQAEQLNIVVTDSTQFPELGNQGDLVDQDPKICRYMVIYDPEGKYTKR